DTDGADLRFLVDPTHLAVVAVDRQPVLDGVEQRERLLPGREGVGGIEGQDDLPPGRHRSPPEAQDGELVGGFGGQVADGVERAEDVAGSAGEVAGVEEVAASHGVLLFEYTRGEAPARGFCRRLGWRRAKLGKTAAPRQSDRARRSPAGR